MEGFLNFCERSDTFTTACKEAVYSTLVLNLHLVPMALLRNVFADKVGSFASRLWRTLQSGNKLPSGLHIITFTPSSSSPLLIAHRSIKWLSAVFALQ